MRKLNVKLFLVLIGAGVLLGGGVVLLHYLQSGRIAGALLVQAERAEKEGRLAESVKFLSRYLEFAPEDLEQRARLGRLLANEQLADTPKMRGRAFFVLEDVLRRDPSRDAVRRQLVDLAMDSRLQRYADAQKHLEKLLESTPENGELELLSGRCSEATGQYREAAAQYEKAIPHAPQQVEVYVRLADVLRRRLSQDKAEEVATRADRMMDQLVEANPDNARAYLARWQYRQQWALLQGPEKLEAGAKDVGRALALAPKEAEVLLAAAELEVRRRNFEKAREHLKQGMQLFGKDVRFYQARASVELEAGQPADAIACLREGVKAIRGRQQLDLLWTLGNALVDSGELGDAGTVLEQMRKAGASGPALDYMNARVLMRQGRWSEAVKLLERARPQLESSPTLAYYVDVFLGQCYEHLDEPSQQLAACSRLVARDRVSAAGHLGMATALAALGRLDDALEQYRQVMACPNAPPGGWIEIARLLIQRHQQRERTDWKTVEQVLQRAEAADPKSIQVPLLRAEAYLAQNEPDRAEAILQKARDARPKEMIFWTALAGLADRRGNFARAERLLDEAQQKAGDAAELRVARARSYASRRGADAAAALDKLATKLEKFNPDEQMHLLSALAEAHYRLGNLKEAARMWAQVAELPRHRESAQVQLLLFDLALQAGDEATIDRVLKDLHRLEGSQGTVWRFCQATRLIWQAQQGGEVSLDEARALLDAVAARRPSWPAVLLAKADVEVLKGRLDQAIAHYQEAINLGERSPRVVRQLVQLLYQRQRYQDADQEIRKLQRRAPLSAEWQRLAADISLRNQDPARAVQMALSAVSSESKDYRDYLWLGQVLAASGRQADDAEEKLRRAVELADTVPETWVALVQFLAASKKTKDAEVAIEQARRKLPAEHKLPALAQCYEAVGRLDEARRCYQEALAAKPQDVTLLHSVASFHLRVGRPGEAEPLLRRLLDPGSKTPAAEVAWARRSLAWALAARRDYRYSAEALELVGLDPAGNATETKKPAGAEAVEEQLAQARVLAAQPRRALRTKAVAILQEMSRRQELLPHDQFLLAQLYETDGSWPKAREQFRTLTTSQANVPLYFSHYARALLRERELGEAERCIDRLAQLEKAQRLEPGALGTVELTCQLLEGRGDWEQAFQLVKGYAEKPDAPPERTMLLIGHLVRRKQFTEALELCDKAWQNCPPEMVGGTTVAVLRAAQAPAEACARAERRLRTAIEKHPDAPQLLLHLADLQDLRGQFEEAEKMYRRLLDRDPNNVVALNNVAWLLAERSGKGTDALPLIDRAIAIHGPQADLLDTRAVVYLALGRSEPAIADLEQANAESPGAARWFHLARAHQLARNSRAALDAFEKARASGLKPEVLHPIERVTFRKVVAELEQR